MVYSMKYHVSGEINYIMNAAPFPDIEPTRMQARRTPVGATRVPATRVYKKLSLPHTRRGNDGPTRRDRAG